MSHERTTSELPTFYGERIQDGSRVERPSEEQEYEKDRDSGDGTTPLVVRPAKTISTRDNVVSPRGPVRDRFSRPLVIHEAGSSAFQRRRSNGRTSKSVDLPRRASRTAHNSFRYRHRFEDYDESDDYDDDYDYPRPVRPYRERYRRRSYEPKFDIPRYSRAMDGRPRRRLNIRDANDLDNEAEYFTPKHQEVRTTFHEKNAPEESMRFDHIAPFDRTRSPPPNPKRISRFQDLSKEERKEIYRLPWTQWMNSNFKNRMHCPSLLPVKYLARACNAADTCGLDFVATLGEFVGTTMFLFFAFAGTQVANIPSGDAAGNCE
ncbi:MAG: hypothetical protein Q9227_008719 [Pyrenula ochraceoflavens]